MLINLKEIIKIFIIYSIIGLFHFYCRKQFFLISQNPQEAFKKGLNVRLWDFLFYVSFGFVVTSSVKIAGVLVVFAFLIVPSTCAIIFSNVAKTRLILGWGIGFLVSAIGMAISYFLDFPTGASVVCAFGVTLVILMVAKKVLSI